MSKGKEKDPYEAARLLLREGRYSEAFEIYERLAALGDPKCQVYVGWMYHEGIGVPRDTSRAIQWFEKAAYLGSKEGAFYLGRCATTAGKHEEGVRWFRQAAAQGFGPASLWLGLAYLNGRGVAVDFPKGLLYLRHAADAGNFFARRQIAILMIKGKLGVAWIPLGLILLPYTILAGIVSALWKGDSEELIG